PGAASDSTKIAMDTSNMVMTRVTRRLAMKRAMTAPPVRCRHRPARRSRLPPHVVEGVVVGRVGADAVEAAPGDGEGGPPVGDADGAPLLLDRLQPAHQAPPLLQVDGHLGPVQRLLKLLVIPAGFIPGA